jgi:hypothetical protein
LYGEDGTEYDDDGNVVGEVDVNVPPPPPPPRERRPPPEEDRLAVERRGRIARRMYREYVDYNNGRN